MLNIQTAVVNNPKFIELQEMTLKKFVQGDYKFTVFNDAKGFPDNSNFGDSTLRKKISTLCSKLNVECVDISNEHHRQLTNPSQRTANSVNYMLNEFQLKNRGKYLVLDSDMFLVGNLKTDYYDDYDCAIVEQDRNVRYFWNGLYYFNTNRLQNENLLNWDCYPGPDTGGAMTDWLKIQEETRKKEIYYIDHLISCRWDSNNFPFTLNSKILDFCKNDVRNKNDKYWSEIYDKKYLHYRAGGNWNKEGVDIHSDTTSNLEKIIIDIVKS